MKKLLITLSAISLTSFPLWMHAQANRPNNFFLAYNDSLYSSALDLLRKRDDVDAMRILNKINTGVSYYDQVLTQKLAIEYRNLNVTEVKKLVKELRIISGGNHRSANIFEGLLYLDEKESGQKALEMFDANLKLTPYTDYTSLFYKGVALYQLKQYPEALKIFEEYVKVNFLNADVHFFLGECYLQEGRLSEALLVLSVGANLAPVNSFANFELSLNAVGDMQELVLEAYEKNKQKNKNSSFAASDAVVASKIALETDLKIKTDVSLNWVKQLLLVLSKNKVKDGNSVVHQLYLPAFSKSVVSNSNDLPYAFYVNKENDLNEEVKISKKLTEATTDIKEKSFKYALFVAGTREFDAAKRSKLNKINYFILNNVATHSMIINHMETPITFDDLMSDKFSGKVTVYSDGYISNITDYAKKNKEVYYGFSKQLHKKWVFTSANDHEYKAYSPTGVLVAEESYVGNDITKLVHYSQFGQKTKDFQYTGNKGRSNVYYPSGALKEYRAFYKSDDHPKEGIDTLVLKKAVDGSIEEYVTRNLKDNVVTNFRVYDDATTNNTYYKDYRTEERKANSVVIYKSKVTYANKISDIQEFYPNGVMKKSSKEHFDKFVYQDLKLYRGDGNQYGYVLYKDGILLDGFMLAPNNDTLWSANHLPKENKLLKVYNELGVLDYSVKLGYDNKLFPEMTEYYANGKKRAYLSKDDQQSDYKFTEAENLYLNGNLKDASEVVDAANSIIAERKYYTNGNVAREIRYITDHDFREVKSYYRSGILLTQFQYDQDFGYFGDVMKYSTNGKLRLVEMVDKGTTLRIQNYNKAGELVNYKVVQSGIDTIKTYDINGKNRGYELYKNGINYGISKSWFHNGKLNELAYYSPDGFLDSLATYYPNGQLRRTEKYSVNGKLLQGTGREITGETSNVYYWTAEGTAKEYDYFGGVKLVKVTSGEELLKMTLLHEKDTIFSTELILEGVVKVVMRDEHNKLVTKFLTDKDKMITAYHTNGKKALDLPLNKFVIDGTMHLYFTTGSVALKAIWKDNMYNGAYQWFHQNGTMIEEQHFAFNYPDISYKYWDPKGKLLINTVNYGSVDSEFHYWNEETQKMEIDMDE